MAISPSMLPSRLVAARRPLRGPITARHPRPNFRRHLSLRPHAKGAPGFRTSRIFFPKVWADARAAGQRSKLRTRRVTLRGRGRAPPASQPPRQEGLPLLPDGPEGETGGAVLIRQAVAMFGAAAVLGPLCDGQHSSHGVLHYTDPVVIHLTPALSLETCWWVPILFGGAGVVLGLSHVLLDRQPEADAPVGGKDPSWPFVLTSITFFVLQYSASGALETPLAGAKIGLVPALDGLLAATAALQWFVFDRTRQGLLMAVLTGIAGPAAEMTLINVLGLYHYSNPQLLGTPSWIAWVYFCGSPAVGNLGRRVLADLNLKAKQSHKM